MRIGPGASHAFMDVGPVELLPLAEVEKRHILRVLDACKGNRTAAARSLQIGRNTLARKLKEYGFADEEGAP
jgi:Nif-specific regulatory protein